MQEFYISNLHKNASLRLCFHALYYTEKSWICQQKNSRDQKAFDQKSSASPKTVSFLEKALRQKPKIPFSCPFMGNGFS
jgi:hypothetical protein